jgi:apolipoprotein N-acyltransferase
MTSFVLLAPVFCIGYFLNEPFFWLHWVGFVTLSVLYQTRRRGHFAKDFLLPCWGLFLAVYSMCFYWILAYNVWVYVFGVLAFSLFFPLFFLLHRFITSKVRSQTAEVAVAAVIFIVFEYLISRFPAVESVGLDFFFQPPEAFLCVLKFFSFKVWSAWIFAACFAVSFCIREKTVRSFVLFGALLGGLAAFVIYAHTQGKSSEKGPSRTVKVALVQHNLPYQDSWRVTHPEEAEDKYKELVRLAAKGDPDLIVFPLYTLPGDVYREPAFLEGLAKNAKSPILLASHVPMIAGDELFDQGFMNFAFLYAPDGKLADTYQAVESLPFNDLPAKKAEQYRVIRGPFGKLGVLLCYEDMIPRLAGQAARDGAKILVSLSNPGFFERTPILYYQLFQDQIRAAETGLPLIRVSPNGYSALIDNTGKIVQRTELNTEEILQLELSGLGPDGSSAENVGDPFNPAR